VIEACRGLKSAGYELALDDFVFKPAYKPLLRMADYVKVDFMQSDAAERRRLAAHVNDQDLALLAEKVETANDLTQAKKTGYSFFQGYFFCKPEVRSGHDLRAAQTSYLQLLQELNAPQPDFDRLEQVIKQDTSLSYKLLKYLNSAAVGVKRRVESIHQALVLLGLQPLRKWGSLIALNGLCADKPEELLVACLTRGWCCEQFGREIGYIREAPSLFVMGLLSGLDAILDRPKEEVLEEVPVETRIKEAVLGEDTELGRISRLALACEQGDWSTVATLAEQLGTNPQRAGEIHREALQWADSMLSRRPSPAAA
jgi:EAL and modified HD-GYP domain-containing signal transduction protein